uniref:Uncharacterized protein n=1 Tax=Mycobacterium leprae TaxID=1769 RepID=O33030_MYCLR|nr:hypothetical protein MLCB250.55 [Mycobacterium leprae]
MSWFAASTLTRRHSCAPSKFERSSSSTTTTRNGSVYPTGPSRLILLTKRCSTGSMRNAVHFAALLAVTGGTTVCGFHRQPEHLFAAFDPPKVAFYLCMRGSDEWNAQVRTTCS